METNFALDYSEAHGLDEGLCYSFTTTNSVFDSSSQQKIVFIPYLAVKDVLVHLEPYKAKLTHKFSP